MFDTFTRAATEIRAVEACARFSLRVSPDHLAQADAAAGMALPRAIQGLSVAKSGFAAMLGPDEWFLVVPEAEKAAVEQRFSALSVPHSLVDISARDIAFDLNGTHAEWIMASLCPADLAAMPAPAACRTIFDKAQIVLAKYSPTHYRMEVWRSFAPHVWALLKTVAEEREAGL